MPKIDLTNKEYEYYTVISRNEERTKANGRNVFWNCRCRCGKEFVATTTEINKQTRKSCGCMKSILASKAHLQDLTGAIFGDLEVIERDFDHPQNGQKMRTYWRCKCKCGNLVSIERTHLVNRAKVSCGCQQSIGEYNIIQLLNNANIKYKSQYTNNLLQTENSGYLRFDFAILNDADEVIRLIEFDGPQHETVDNYFDDKEIFTRYQIKNNYAKNNNIPLIRIPYYKRDTLTLEDIMGSRFLL